MRSLLLRVVLLPVVVLWGADLEGVLNLDEVTFEKITKAFDVVVKFDKQYAYGDKETAWKAVATKAAKQGPDTFLVATVGVQDYGLKANEKLAEREGAKKEKWPLVRAYLRDGSRVDFSDEFTEANLLRFVQKFGVWLGLDGTVEVLDSLVKGFCEKTKDEQVAVLDRAKQHLNIPETRHYVKSMQKIIDAPVPADQYLATEIARMKKVIAGKLTDAKRKEIQQRLNILYSFQRDTPTKGDEL